MKEIVSESGWVTDSKFQGPSFVIKAIIYLNHAFLLSLDLRQILYEDALLPGKFLTRLFFLWILFNPILSYLVLV